MWWCLDVLKDFPGDPAAKNDGGDGGVECTSGRGWENEESVWAKNDKEEKSEPAKVIKWMYEMSGGY